MTISSEVRKAGPYSGNGIAQAFPFYFKIFDKSDLLVIKTIDATGVESSLALDVDYAVAKNQDQETSPGGTVAMLTPPPAGVRITIVCKMQMLQTADITNQGGFYPEILENALDRLTIICQQIDEKVERSVKLPASSQDDPDGLIAEVIRSSSVASQAADDASSSAASAAASAASAVGAESAAQSHLLELLSSDFLASRVIFSPAGPGGVSQRVDARLSRVPLSTDFSSSAHAASGQRSYILVPQGGVTSPISSAQNIAWDFLGENDSRNVVGNDGSRGGFFADYDCKGMRSIIAHISDDQTNIPGGGFRDVLFVNAVDADPRNYSTVGQKVTYGVRSYVQGLVSAGSYQSQYKDLVGGEFYAVGNIQWNDRGTSGVTAAAVQYGSGIASNEFAVQNVAPGASGGVSQSVSMAAVQAIVRARFAADDGGHVYRGVLVTNSGYRITSGVELLSEPGPGFSSEYRHGIKMSGATVSSSAIVMPQSSSGNTGTIIEYDQDDYSQFDRASNSYSWVVSGAIKAAITPSGIAVGSTTIANAFLFIEPGSSSKSQIQLYPGADRVSPGNGEIWFNGSDVKICIGGITKTFAVS